MRIVKASWPLALLFLALLGALAATPLLEQPPPVRTSNAGDQFNAARALSRLALLLGDQRAHPADSAANDLVRARLVGELKHLGLEPIVRDQFACNQYTKRRGVSCARVHNVIARLGPATGKALLLNAHYDSVAAGPGASDDGMGVATLLEVASILQHRRLNRPMILLFNEGEELGLVGARAFLADPLSRNVDSLVNLEARGVRGPVNMFETSRPNGLPLRIYAAAVRRPVANSLATDVYHLLPNATDVNSFAERGWLALNLAPIGNETRYHSAGDDLAAVDPATLQHMGDQTLALTEYLADGGSAPRSGDRMFMDIAGRVLIVVPMLGAAIVLVVLLLAYFVLAIRAGAVPRSITLMLGTFAGSAMLAWLALALIGIIREGEFWRAEPLWTHLASYASTILVAVALLTSVGKQATVRQLRIAFWLFLLCVGGLVGLVAPGGIIFFLFPPVVALAGVLARRWWAPAEHAASAAAIILLYVVWGGLLGLLEELLDNGPMWLFAPLASLIILPALIEARELIARTGTRLTTALAAAFALAVCIATAAAPAYSADRQQRFVIEHVTDASTHKSWWSVLNDGARPTAFPGSWSRTIPPFDDKPRWLSPAPLDAGHQPPQVELLTQARTGRERTLTLRLKLNGNDNAVLNAPPDAAIRSAGAPNFVRPIESGHGKFSISCWGRSCDGATITLRTQRLQPIRFTILGSRGALPAGAQPVLVARPRFARPQYKRDESIVFTRVNL